MVLVLLILVDIFVNLKYNMSLLHICFFFLLLLTFVDNSNCSCYVFREAFIKMAKKLSAFVIVPLFDNSPKMAISGHITFN